MRGHVGLLISFTLAANLLISFTALINVADGKDSYENFRDRRSEINTINFKNIFLQYEVPHGFFCM